MKLNDLEFSSNYDTDRPPEIIRWFPTALGQSKYTLLFYEKNSEGYYVQFIGDRPFDDAVDANALWKLMQYGQAVLNARFKLEDE